ncbi:MAG: hypothetical protein GC160_11090 [Acidobacteria bacterium]|nr:hypothetical protein [Acidobacteriota bacterium]
MRFIVLSALSAALLLGQQDAHKGRIVGTVVDPSGAVVPGAHVTVTSQSTGVSREVETNGDGRYQVIALDPDTYELVATSDGFAPATFSGIVLSVGGAVDIPVQLQVQATDTVVTVTASMIDATLPTANNVVNSTAITNLPINGRRFQDFALLTPTVQVDRQRGQVAFVGQRGINSNVMVDGTDYNQPFFGGIRGGERSNSIITVPQSSVKEFQAVSSGYTAEYGRSSGGMLNVLTKSGTNQLHGDGFYQIRHRNWGSEDPFGFKILETLQQFGGSAGGPIRKDNAFWFFAVERQVADTPRQVYFSNLQDVDPATGQQAYDHFKSLEESFKSTNDAWALTPKLDWYLTPKHSLTLRYNYSTAQAANSVSTGDPRAGRTNFAVSANGQEGDRIHYGTAQLTSVLKPTIINELRFTTSYEERPRTANSEAASVETFIGNYGTRSFLPTVQDDKRIQFQDGLSINKGSHSVKLGVDYNYVDAAQAFGFNQFGDFQTRISNASRVLDILTPGGAVANRFDVPLSEARYFRQIGNLATSLGIHQAALFAQDFWQVTNKLSLNLGLRWEGQYNPTPDASNASLTDRVRDAALPLGKVDPAYIPNATDQIMPRFGFAYRPFDANKTVIRGSAGIFYASTPLLLFSDAMNNFRSTPGNLSIQLPTTNFPTLYQQFQANGIDLNSYALDQLPVFSIEQIQQIAGGGADPFAGAAPLTISDNYRNPRSTVLTLGVDHEIFDGLVAGIQFQNVNTSNLQRNRNYNLPAPTFDPVLQINKYSLSNRPIPSLGTVTVRESSARSLYRGVTMSGKYRFNSRLQWDAYYTYSQTYSDDDNERSSSGFNYNDPFNLQLDYGPAAQDIRHQVTSNAVVRLPFGIEWSGILRITSGAPINPVAGTDINGDGNSSFISSSGNTSDRALSAPGVFLARNSFRNRGFHNFDMRVMKRVNFNEKMYAQLSVEMFNLFNLNNVELRGTNTVYGTGLNLTTGAPIGPAANWLRLRNADGSFNNSNGQIPGAAPFQMQLGARFFF